jgi:hypothetical protein
MQGTAQRFAYAPYALCGGAERGAGVGMDNAWEQSAKRLEASLPDPVKQTLCAGDVQDYIKGFSHADMKEKNTNVTRHHFARAMSANA